jgi:hypothetical protein
MSGIATVKDRNPNVAPTLTAGRVTPEALHRWERACKEYFRTKQVAADKQVVSVISRLQDLRIADWIEANEATLVALKFPAFMDKLRGEALERDWDRKIKLSMLASKQGDRPFHEWAYEIQARNALLRGRKYHFSEEALRETLENNMDQDLELRARRTIRGISLQDWIENVRVEDEYMTRGRKDVEKIAREIARELYRKEAY